MRSQFGDGVTYLPLAPIRDPSLVTPTMAQALGVRESSGQPLIERIIGDLHDEAHLLVLDNFEHLVSAGQILTELLTACPRLKMLVTSRSVLHLAGEQTFPLAPLAVPELDLSLSLEHLSRYAAINLFVERAAAVSPSFALTGDNLHAMAETCRQLDGIPLAIELAAPWVRVLSLEQIAARLTNQLALLTDQRRSTSSRQQTLRAAVGWSYSLLSEPERLLWQRLSVFNGGWTLTAAEQVCSGGPIGKRDVLDILAALVDQSVVVVEQQHGAVRYRLLETMRQYGSEHLESAGQTATFRQRHGEWFLALAEEAEPELVGPRQREWLERLATEQSNLRAALRWFAHAGAADEGVRLAAATFHFWATRGYYSEGLTWLERMLDSGPTQTATRAKALFGAGDMASLLGDGPKAVRYLTESVALRRQLGDKRGAATSLHHLATVLHRSAQHERVAALHHEALALWRELDDRGGIADSLHQLGIVAHERGDHRHAAALYEQALTIRRDLGVPWGIAEVLDGLGGIAEEQGDLERSVRLYEDALAIKRTLGNKLGIAASLEYLGALARRHDEFGHAVALHEEALAIKREIGVQEQAAFSLYNLCLTRLAQGERERALALALDMLALTLAFGGPPDIARRLEGMAVAVGASGMARQALWLLGAAQTVRQAADVPPLNRDHLARKLADLRGALPADEFAGCLAEGRTMTAEAAVRRALTDLPATAANAGVSTPAKATPDRLVTLTPREREVAVLVAHGLTNRQIAGTLVIAEGTAALHVEHIRDKLGFQSRAKIAAWVVAQGCEL